MKAARIHEHGDLDVIQVEEAPEPKAGPGEVVLSVKAAALNHLDIWVRKGRPGLTLEFPHILGSDAAGVVAEVGPGVGQFSIGDEVVLNPGLSCGHCEFCHRGEQSECLNFGVVGMNRPGTFAESVAVPAGNLRPKPNHLSFEEAAAFPLAHLTAWRMLMTRARLSPGETALIHGIGGGVALAALQFAEMFGAVTIVTSSSEEKLARAKELGADHGINYSDSPDVAEAVMDITNGRGVDIVIDTVGAATWPINFGSVRRGGRIVHCGVTTGPTAEVNISALYWNHIEVLGSTLGSHEEFRLMVEAVGRGMKPVIDCIESLDNAQEVTGRMETGGQFGKIILKP